MSAEYEKLELQKEPGNVAVAANIFEGKNFAYVEFRTPDEATESMALDGVKWDENTIAIRRPSDYNTPLGSTANQLIKLGIAESSTSPDQIFVGGIPHYLTEDQIKDLLQAFGELRSFTLLKDHITGESRVHLLI
jgi:splicing factor U2AF subunit